MGVVTPCHAQRRYGRRLMAARRTQGRGCSPYDSRPAGPACDHRPRPVTARACGLWRPPHPRQPGRLPPCHRLGRLPQHRQRGHARGGEDRRLAPGLGLDHGSLDRRAAVPVLPPDLELADVGRVGALRLERGGLSVGRDGAAPGLGAASLAHLGRAARQRIPRRRRRAHLQPAPQQRAHPRRADGAAGPRRRRVHVPFAASPAGVPGQDSPRSKPLRHSERSGAK